MSEKIIIASDSTTDLGPELIERFHVQILPLVVSVGENRYLDGIEITPDDLYAYYEKDGTLPKTSAPNMSDFTEFFKQYTDKGYTVIYFSISSQMSSAYNNACLAAEELENVYVIDSRNLSSGGGLSVVSACKMVEEGKSAKEIVEACNALTARVDASFIIDKLELLYKGGRCSAVEAFGANLLQIKPCIVVRNGKMSVGKKYRGKFADAALRYITDQIGDGSDIEQDFVFFTHAGCDEELCKKCVDHLKSLANFKEVFVTRAGCTVSSHCGRNTLGVLFIRKNPLAVK